jgi:hypothetical protein
VKKIKSEEEKAANAIAKIVCDLRLDLDAVGKHYAWNVGSMGYNRLVLVLDAAEDEKVNNKWKLQ